MTGWTGNDTQVLELAADDMAPEGGGQSVIDGVLRDGIALAGDVAALRRLRTPRRRARSLPSSP